RVRFLTGAGTADFSDDDVQAALDQTRIDVHHEQLSAVVDRVGGGALEWREYRSRYRWFEATDGGTARFVVEDTLGSVRGTADWSADYQAGVVTFAQDQRGTSLFLSGHSFDPYG